MTSISSVMIPTCLVLDFDGTLTISDTTAIIGQINKTTRNTWPTIVQAYMSDYARFQNQSFDWKNYDVDEYSQWLDSRKPIETASARRAADHGLFEGLTIANLRESAKEGLDNGSIVFRPGWIRLIESAMRFEMEGGRSAILSVSWSRTFVRECLVEAIRRSERSNESVLEYVENMKIYANEIASLSSTNEPVESTGKVQNDEVRTIGDKLRIFKQIIESAPRVDGKLRSIYVGDSATDFGCLHYADIGVWVYDTSSDEMPSKFREMFKPLRAEPPLRLNASVWDMTGPYGKSLFFWSPDLLFDR